MINKDYNKSITANITAKEAFKNITNVSGWWTSHFKGTAANLNDTFRLMFRENWFSFKVTGSIPNTRLVWLVTDSDMFGINDWKEWKDTKIVWNIQKDKKGIKIDMTHMGLVPGIECYDVCSTGWNNYVGESLPRLLKTGKGVLFDD